MCSCVEGVTDGWVLFPAGSHRVLLFRWISVWPNVNCMFFSWGFAVVAIAAVNRDF